MDSESEPARQGRPQTHLDANADTWAAAVDMYRNRYSFLAVGPRLHEDWLPDVAAEWRSRLFEIPRSAVVRLLVMLATDGMEVSRQYGFTDRRMGIEEHAQVILSRFPEGSQFFTNTRHYGAHPDFYEKVTGCWPMSQYAWDFGLLAVSRAEVGLIWSFDAS
ncbi:hypothetical protein [Streptomyces bobili]|uniref:hypothetical protein n=1 Tax=Streptomyces bobili TaxID=67280 RepID=UPI00371EEFE3